MAPASDDRSLQESSTRRTFIRASALTAAGLSAGVTAAERAAEPVAHPPSRPLLTPAGDFYDVSRGNPKPHTLTGEALAEARLTPETWRLEILADSSVNEVVKEPASIETSFTLADGTALALPALMTLGSPHRVRFIKAMQCLNIAEPLGQGLWEGVPLRDLLRLCGTLKNVRRIYYWGFHNNDPKQVFRSSLSYSEAMETAPGDLPAFVAWRLNGAPIPLARGGPVRMVIPWAHGFKSIKWLQRIMLTNDYRANDTYAEKNNDPDSPLKTAAYIDKLADRFPAGQPVFMTGRVISGLSGVQRVERLVRRIGHAAAAPQKWAPCELEAPPADWSRILPSDVSSRDVLGFDRSTGRPLTWPLRYSMISWSAVLKDLQPGHYEFQVRAVDLNGFAQPEPRPSLKAGRNALETHRFEVV